MPDRLQTVMVGFGRIASGYARDLRMAKWFPYATHAQVLACHPRFEWTAVVDPDPTMRNYARSGWGIKNVVSELNELRNRNQFQVAVIATPPNNRIKILEMFPNLSAIVVEKPLANDLKTARLFLNNCAERGIIVQVNFPRRADVELRRLATSLPQHIGEVQAAFALYGNGLNNNGSHLVDMVRMFLGEITWVKSLSASPVINESPIVKDFNFPFVLGLSSGICVMVQPLKFKYFRENSLDIWGKEGRLSFYQEGLTFCISPRREHRFLLDKYEIASDQSDTHLTGQGNAMFELYNNLARALGLGEALWSGGESALKTMMVIEAIRKSFDEDGKYIKL